MAKKIKKRIKNRETENVFLSWPGRPHVSTFLENKLPHISPVEIFPSLGERESPSTDVVQLFYGKAIEVLAYFRNLRRSHLSEEDKVNPLGRILHQGVDLIYLDPPYASQANYTLETRLDGSANGRIKKSAAYTDVWDKKKGGLGAYLDMLAPALKAMCEMLSDRGSIWVHVDYRVSYLVRLLLDEYMGREAFRNEIVWRRAPNLGRQAASGQFGRTLDTIVVYANSKAKLIPPMRSEYVAASHVRKDENSRFFTTAPRGDYTDLSIKNLEKEGRIHRARSGKVYIKYFVTKMADGSFTRERPIDALWTDIAPLRHGKYDERTGFPTQKPNELLERIIRCATVPNDVVMDLFSGSGTTAEVAAKMGRNVVAGDQGKASISIIRSRLLRAQSPYVLYSVFEDQTAFSDKQDFEIRAYCKKMEPTPHHVSTKTQSLSFEVFLEWPKEPLAWGIDTKSHQGPFQIHVHSERSLGRRPLATAISLKVSRRPKRIRVWQDGGEVSTLVLTPRHFEDQK